MRERGDRLPDPDADLGELRRDDFHPLGRERIGRGVGMEFQTVGEAGLGHQRAG